MLQRCQPHAELTAGLVEVGVGLLPGAGGCKEMLLRAIDSAESIRPGGRGGSRCEPMEAMKKCFETIATVKRLLRRLMKLADLAFWQGFGWHHHEPGARAE